jgi:folate-binding protein YgfZ
LIQAGIPTITAATQEQFVPQMANLEQLGAVSFEKGCYPGQEIVARAQYRGEVKRRLYQLHAAADAAMPGQEVFRASGGACGTVVNAAPAPGGGVDLLAVVLTSAAAEGDLRLGDADGPALSRWR